MVQLIAYALLLSKELVALFGIAAKAQSEGRDPTPEEWAEIRGKRQESNSAADAAGI